MEEKNTKDAIKKEEEKEENKKEVGDKHLNKVDKVFKKIFFVLLILTIIGTITLLSTGITFAKNLRKLHPEYHFVGWYEIIIGILYVPVLLLIQAALYKILSPFIVNYLSEEYLVDEETKKKSKTKFMFIIYKTIYFTTITLIGHLSLINYDWYPRSLLGHGELKNMIKENLVESLIFEKSPLFDLHYEISLAYAIADMIWLFEDINRTDFINMLFHHICTLSLVLFSYIINASHIGAVVQVLHNAADVIVYINRLFIYGNFYVVIRRVTPITLIFGFTYFRMFCLGQCIYTIYKYCQWKWSSIETSLVLFLVFLYIIHFYWIIVISKKIIDALFKGKYSDTFEYTKKKKKIIENEKKTQ